MRPLASDYPVKPVATNFCMQRRRIKSHERQRCWLKNTYVCPFPRLFGLQLPSNRDPQGTASNIKSRVNRLSVLSAITSTQQRLKLYNKVPPNGLVVYCGEIITSEGKERKINIDFEPFKPINTSLYLCDNKFHTEALSELLESDQKFGFIVMDGNGALFGTLSGNTREILQRLSVDLPKKHVSFLLYPAVQRHAHIISPGPWWSIRVAFRPSA